MLGVVVIATGVTALVARNIYQRQSPGSPPIVVSSSQTSVPPAQEPGPATVAVSPDAANSPWYAPVRRLAQSYFDAINTHNYNEWTSVVTTALADEQPQAQFKKGYATTKDGSIEILRIDQTPEGQLRVLLTFHSTQSIPDAPKNSQFGCVAWQVVWPVVRETDGTLRTDVSGGSDPNVPLRQQCAS